MRPCFKKRKKERKKERKRRGTEALENLAVCMKSILS
jgi:hypothetical protein